MPRKPKVERRTITVVIDKTPIAVTLHPPTAARKSWYAYWAGLVTSKSTGRAGFDEAVVVAGSMLRRARAGGGSSQPVLADLLMSNEEFVAIQKEHYGKRKGADAQARAAKSLKSCLEAVNAFKVISGLSPITVATPDDCAAFQRRALELPKTTLFSYPNSKEGASCYSANTVVKWSVALQAAWERSSRAGGK